MFAPFIQNTSALIEKGSLVHQKVFYQNKICEITGKTTLMCPDFAKRSVSWTCTLLESLVLQAIEIANAEASVGVASVCFLENVLPLHW